MYLRQVLLHISLTHDSFHHLGCGLKRFAIVRDYLAGKTSSGIKPLKTVDESLGRHIWDDIQMYGPGSTTGVETNPHLTGGRACLSGVQWPSEIDSSRGERRIFTHPEGRQRGWQGVLVWLTLKSPTGNTIVKN